MPSPESGVGRQASKHCYLNDSQDLAGLRPEHREAKDLVAVRRYNGLHKPGPSRQSSGAGDHVDRQLRDAIGHSRSICLPLAQADTGELRVDEQA